MLKSSQLRDITIKDYLLIIKRRVWIILVCLVITTTDATMKTLKKVPLYQAGARILIERAMTEIAPIRQVYTPSWDKEYIQIVRQKVLDWVRTRHFTNNSQCQACSIKNTCFNCPGKAWLETGNLEGRINWYCDLARLV